MAIARCHLLEGHTFFDVDPGRMGPDPKDGRVELRPVKDSSRGVWAKPEQFSIITDQETLDAIEYFRSPVQRSDR